MKKLLALILTLTSFISFGQQANNEAGRFIEVTGDGEVKVDPNIIYLSIELREYKKEGKIVKLEELEAQLVKILQTVGIPQENLKVYGSSGRQNDYKISKSNLIIGKRYNLKLNDVSLLNPLLGELGEAKILSVWISEVTHTEIDKFKTDAKIKAINDAKTKATLLTTTLDSKLGQVLQIRETELVDFYPVQALQGRVSGLQARGTSQLGYYEEQKFQTNSVDFEQIKLTYKIIVKFEIL